MEPRKASELAVPIHINEVKPAEDGKGWIVNNSTYNIGRNKLKKAMRKPYGMPKKKWEAQK
jgi:hypothetical protein